METREPKPKSVPAEPSNHEDNPDLHDSPPLPTLIDQTEESILGALPELSIRFEIFNKTPRRIAISRKETEEEGEHYTGELDYLVIAPFSTKVVSKDSIEAYDCMHWQQEDLIDIKPMQASGDDNLSALGYGVGCGFLLVIYLVVALLVPILRTNLLTWILFAGLFLVGMALIASSSGGLKSTLKRFGRGILQALNLGLFLIVVLGLGVGMFYVFSGGKEILATGQFSLESLGRVIQYLFLTIATLLPALMYFLFTRHQREKIQDDFVRELLRLDPGIRTLSEAESKYLSRIQETLGSIHTSAFLFSSGLPILLCTLLIYMGWLVVLQPFNISSPINVEQLENLLVPRVNAVTFAFLGAYFFAVSMVFRRYVRADLTPKTYTHIILRLLLAIILAWTLSALPVFAGGGSVVEAVGTVVPMISGGEGDAQGAADPASNEAVPAAGDGDAEASGFSIGLLYLLAFFIGIFPETGTTVLQDLARNPFFLRLFPRLEEEHPLTRLDGINLYDRARFMEEGIENIENLAHHNLIDLMLSTRISTNRLVDLYDQAILYLHLGLDPKAIAQTRTSLRTYGIRTATDLESAYQSAEIRGSEVFEKFLLILDKENTLPTPLSRIQTLLDTLRDDDWMNYLRNWRELNQRSTQTFTLKGVSLVPLEDTVQRKMAMAY